MSRAVNSGSYGWPDGLEALLGLPALGRGPQGRHAGGGHAVEPVEPLGLVRGQPRHADHPDDPLPEQRTAGQGVGPAAGVAHDPEPVDAQGVGDAGDVARRRRHVAPLGRRRAAVAGAVVGHPAEAEALGGREQGRRGRPDVGRAVVPEHGETLVAARRGVVHVQHAAVVEPQLDLLHDSHPTTNRSPVPGVVAPGRRSGWTGPPPPRERALASPHLGIDRPASRACRRARRRRARGRCRRARRGRRGRARRGDRHVLRLAGRRELLVARRPGRPHGRGAVGRRVRHRRRLWRLPRRDRPPRVGAGPRHQPVPGVPGRPHRPVGPGVRPHRRPGGGPGPGHLQPGPGPGGRRADRAAGEVGVVAVVDADPGHRPRQPDRPLRAAGRRRLARPHPQQRQLLDGREPGTGRRPLHRADHRHPRPERDHRRRGPAARPGPADGRPALRTRRRRRDRGATGTAADPGTAARTAADGGPGPDRPARHRGAGDDHDRRRPPGRCGTRDRRRELARGRRRSKRGGSSPGPAVLVGAGAAAAAGGTALAIRRRRDPAAPA